MPFCNECGAEVIEYAEICPKCGTRLRKAEEKMFYRSRTNRWISGVCGGVAEATGIPALLIRIGMILFGCSVLGILMYITLACLLPEK